MAMIKHCFFFAFVIAVFFSLSFFPLHGLDPDTPIHMYQVDEWSKKSLRLGYSVYNIMQTPDGYMWLECSVGVVRFDGREFIPLHRLDFARGYVNDRDFLQLIMIDSSGALWMLKNCGCVLLYQDGAISALKVDSKERCPVNTWTGVKDSFGNAWLGTYNNLYCYRDNRFIEFGPGEGIPGRGISSLLEDSCGQLWVASNTDGIFKLKAGRFSPVRIEGIDPTTVVVRLYEDRSGGIWIGTNRGLFLQKDKQLIHLTTSEGLSHNSVTKILEDSGGNIWVGTKNGINRIRKHPRGRFRIDNCLDTHIIKSIYEDEEKNLWIGTDGQGLKRLRDTAFHTLDLGDGHPDFITSIHRTAAGDTWTGTRLGELMRIKDGKVAETIAFEDQINSLADDRRGNLWVGTLELGLFRLGPDREVHHYKKELDCKYIPALYCDSRNRLWIATPKGFAIYRDGEFTTFFDKEKFPGGFINFFREDGNGSIWIGGRGLFLLPKGDLNPEGIVDVLAKSPVKLAVTCMFQDDDGSLWLGTPCGLARKKGDHISLFHDNIHWRNSMNSAVQHIFKHDDGHLWLNTLDGIVRINCKELDDLVEGKTRWLLPRGYGACDGIKCAESIALSYHSMISPRKGEYWFATKRGIVVLRPENVKINKVPPQVAVEKIKVNGGDIRISKPGPDSELTLENTDHLRFYFTAATFASQEGVCFKYKLKGHDNQWTWLQPGKERIAEYWDLPAGSYTFSVNACNNDGVWNCRAAEVTFHVPALILGLPLWLGLLLAAFPLLTGTAYLAYCRRRNNTKSTHDQAQAIPEMSKDVKHLMELKALMEEKKVYKDEGVSLKSLSLQLNINDRYLSHLINERLKKSFFDLINHYRVEEAKRMLVVDNDRKNVLEIAYEVGFNTKSAFNRAFKKHTSMTPTQFRDSAGNSGSH